MSEKKSSRRTFVATTLAASGAFVAGTSTPEAVAQDAPRSPGERFRDDLGSLAPGNSADFLVLEANPLEDIRNTTRIAGVYRKGRPLDRAARRAAWVR